MKHTVYSLTWIFLLNTVSVGLSMLLHITVTCSCLLLCSIPLYELDDEIFVHFYVGNHLSCLQFLTIFNKVAMAFLHMSFGKHMNLFLIIKYLGVELLFHRVSIYFALVDSAKNFSQVVVPIFTSTIMFITAWKGQRCYGNKIWNWLIDIIHNISEKEKRGENGLSIQTLNILNENDSQYFLVHFFLRHN